MDPHPHRIFDLQGKQLNSLPHCRVDILEMLTKQRLFPTRPLHPFLSSVMAHLGNDNVCRRSITAREG